MNDPDPGRGGEPDGGDYPDPPEEPETVSPAALSRRIDAGEPVRLLDVRDRDEFEAWSIDGAGVVATQLPFARALQAEVTGDVDGFAERIDGEGPITVVCGRGEASAYVAAVLAEAGYDARNLADGMRGWARVYETAELSVDPTVVQYRRPSSGCLGYLVVAGDEAAVVDPLRAFADRYAADAAERGADLRYAIDTHVHADHFSGVRAVAAASDAEPVTSAAAVDRGVTFDVRTVADGEALPLGGTALRAVALPGHTTGTTGVAVGDLLLTGDSLFVESVARPDLEAGDEGAPELARELYRTLTERLAAFDDATTVAPGHYGPGSTPREGGGYAATLGELRASLWAFDVDETTFVERVCGDMPPRPANFERIIAANLGTEAPDDETAFELELGPNNCAATPSAD